MIVLQILLWLFVGIIALVLLVLLAPVSVMLSLQDKFSAKVSVFGIPVFSTARKRPKKEKTEKQQQKKQVRTQKKDEKKAQKPKKKNIWQRATEQHEFADTVKGFGSLALAILKKAMRIFKHIHFRKFRFRLDYGTPDAAQTAIQYGVICSVVYPVLERLFAISDCKAKQIDINADFNHPKSMFQFSVAVRTQPIWFVIIGLSALRVYKKWERDFLE